MIPTVDENCNTYLANDEHSNVGRNSAEWRWHSTAATAAHGDNQIENTFRLFTSRTDKPRLAHEVYFQWLGMPALNDDNVTCNLTQRLLLTQKDLLIAAFSGPSIMYRK